MHFSHDNSSMSMLNRIWSSKVFKILSGTLMLSLFVAMVTLAVLYAHSANNNNSITATTSESAIFSFPAAGDNRKVRIYQTVQISTSRFLEGTKKYALDFYKLPIAFCSTLTTINDANFDSLKE